MTEDLLIHARRLERELTDAKKALIIIEGRCHSGTASTQMILAHDAEMRYQSVLNYNASLHQQLSENKAAYETVKSHMRNFQSLLLKCQEEFAAHADGAPDATPLCKFCNRMISELNDKMLSQLSQEKGEDTKILDYMDDPKRDTHVFYQDISKGCSPELIGFYVKGLGENTGPFKSIRSAIRAAMSQKERVG